jgi:hypothetical protein
MPRTASGSSGNRQRKHKAAAAAFDAFAELDHEGTAAAASSVAVHGQFAYDPRSYPAPPPPPPPPPPPEIDPGKIYSAARHGRHHEVEAQLVAGFDPRYKDSFGNSLFHVACQNGNKRIAKLAIKFGGNMDDQNVKGQTGLHFLFAYGYPEVAEYFIEKGANEYIPNESGLTAREGINR